jgi:AsmA protein
MKPSKKPASPSSITQALLGIYGIVGVTISTFGIIRVPFAESHAKDYWRHAVMGLILIFTLIAGIISLAVYMFDANYFKSEMVDYVKTHYQRDLTLEGDIKVTFFPKLGLNSGKMTLSQRNSKQNFSSIENARLYISWWPILFKQIQVESVVLDGVHANIIRYKNGTSNLEDLFSSEGKLNDIKFEIDNIKINNSSANIQDETSDLYFSLHNLNIETEKIADATPAIITTQFRLESSKPHIDTKVKISSHILFELKTNHYEFSNFEGEVEGEAAGLNILGLNFQGTLNSYPGEDRFILDKFNATTKGKWDNRRLEVKIEIPQLKLIKNEMSASAIALNTTLLQDDENLSASMQIPALTIKENKLSAENMTANFDLFMQGKTVQGNLSSPFNLDLSSKQLQLSSLSSNLNITHPILSNKINATVNGEILANFPEQDVKSSVKIKIDDSNIVGNISLHDFQQPVYIFDIGTNQLDLDHYLAIDWAKRLQNEALVFDFSNLKEVNFHGKFRSNDFKFANLKTHSFVAEIRNENATLNIDPISASLYGGTSMGSFTISTNETPQISLKQKLTGVQINELLDDFIPGPAKLTGKGNFTFALNATGENIGALRKTLNGNINLALTQGTVQGMNLIETLLANQKQIGVVDAELNEPAKFTESTAYTQLKSSFDINEGKAHSSDFSLKSALFNSSGDVAITFESGVLDTQLNTSVNANLKRSSHGEIADLKGINFPMQIFGSYLTPTIKINFATASGGNLTKLLDKNKTKLEPTSSNPAQTNANAKKLNKNK